MMTQVRAYPTVKTLAASALVKFISRDCLFDISSALNHGSNSPPRCKTAGTRRVAFELLGELVGGNPQGTLMLCNLISEEVTKIEMKSNFNFSPDVLVIFTLLIVSYFKFFLIRAWRRLVSFLMSASRTWERLAT